MDELREMERQRRRLNAEALCDDACRQPRRTAGDQQPEQREAGFLGKRPQGSDRMLMIHNRDFQRSTSVQICALIASSRDILKIAEATYHWEGNQRWMNSSAGQGHWSIHHQ